MRYPLFWLVIYTLVLALGQIFLKLGMNRVPGIKLQGFGEALRLLPALIMNPYLLLGTGMMAGSFFLWLTILSWFKLGLVFPLTAMTYIFVALLSYFMLGEKLILQNYAGIVLIAFGIFFLLYR